MQEKPGVRNVSPRKEELDNTQMTLEEALHDIEIKDAELKRIREENFALEHPILNAAKGNAKEIAGNFTSAGKKVLVGLWYLIMGILFAPTALRKIYDWWQNCSCYECQDSRKSCCDRYVGLGIYGFGAGCAILTAIYATVSQLINASPGNTIMIPLALTIPFLITNVLSGLNEFGRWVKNK